MSQGVSLWFLAGFRARDKRRPVHVGSMLSVDLIPPRASALNPRVEKMSGRTSQHKQDAWVDSALKRMRNGFVVESGACAPRSDDRLVAPVPL